MAAPKKQSVELGFIVEKSEEPWQLLSHYFPSKVGGKPAWLSFKPIPSDFDLSCKVCGKRCSFLLQAYAPIDDKPSCFHRTLFVFICRNPDCCQPNDNKNLIVFRSQLQRRNDFYPDSAPGEFDPKSDYPRVEKLQGICIVCGCQGSKRCGKCQGPLYCSKEHQLVDWTTGGHKNSCGNVEGETKRVSSVAITGVLFKEFELDYEPEELMDETEAEKSEEEKLLEYKKFLESAPEGSTIKDAKLSVAELEMMAGGKDADDKQFALFKKQIDSEPEQVIRYQRGGVPLWITDKSIPKDEDIPHCQSCGGVRQFEFQILPQLLTHLDVDDVGSSIDWGTLAVYTCVSSCDAGGCYGQEFVWKQDFEYKR